MTAGLPSAAISPGGRRATVLQAALLVAIVVVTVATAMTVHFRIEVAIEQAHRLVGRATADATTVHDVIDSLRDAETGQRGYLLTLRPAYLTPYWAGTAQLAGALAALDRTAADRPDLRPDIQAMHDLALRKVDEMQRTIAMAGAQGREAAIAEIQTDVGRATMESVRHRAQTLMRRLAVDHETLLEEVRARERLAARAGMATSTAGGVLLGIAALVMLRGRIRMQQTERALREQTERLAATIANLRDGVAVFDAGQRLLLWNIAFSRLTGHGPAGHIGRSLQQGDDLASVLRRADAVAGGGPAFGRILHAAPTAGSPLMEDVRVRGLVLEVWRGRMPDGGDIVLVADITRRTEAEAIARQAQKMEALGQLTGGVAHDFNNLLQVISANLELIEPRLGAAPALAAKIAAALGAVARAARLTRHLLAFARRQPLAPEPIDPSRLLSGIEEMLRRTLGEGIAIEMRLAHGLWPVRADPQQLESAILNLTINARDAMAAGGRLTIEASNLWLDADDAATNVEVAPGAYVAIAITDTGTGMTADQLGRALEPFYTTKPEGRGSGLGLSMVYGFAKQSEGHFQLVSEPGRGTTARLFLPRSDAAPAPAAEPAPLRRPASGELVLVVEDDASVRASACQAVRDLGYRAVEAASAAAALALLRHGVRPDVLFTDIVMPGEPDARTLAREAERLVPGLAVLFTSGYADGAVIHDGQVEPGTLLLSKPWRLVELGERLRAALEARQPSDQILPGSGAAQTRLRIVVAEDEMVVRMITADLLAELGHVVVEAATGAEALSALRDGADLLLTDVGLPDIDGIDLAQRARDAQPGLRVVVASGRDARADEFHVWLAKPYDEAGLREAIARAMALPA